MARTKKQLNKAEVKELLSVYNRLCDIYSKHRDKDLQTNGNGTVEDNLSCAVASIEVILQDYL